MEQGSLARDVAVVAVLVFLSQVFTGLNLGLMSLDTAQLKVLIDVRHRDEASFKAAMYAKKILPLRQQGNLLLCTILMGNVAANTVMSIWLAKLAGGAVGFLVSTALQVVLCEIVPQSVCTRWGLFLGAKGAPIIRIAMILMYVVVKPYALVLDCFFPQRENMLDRSQLRALVEYQKTAQPELMASGQAEMVIGALRFAETAVKEVMVPLEDAFAVRSDAVLDYDLVASVVQSGFSRIPVLCLETGRVRGLLHCKDLLKQRFLHAPVESVFAECSPAAAAPLQTAADLMQALEEMHQARDVYFCDQDTKLNVLLAQFKRRPHLAVVTDGNDGHLGIVTLQNLFETLLSSEHFEEETKRLSRTLLLKQAGTVRIFDPRLHDGTAEEPIEENEAEAIAAALAGSCTEFSPGIISHEELLRLLGELQPVRLARHDVLYERGQPASCGTLVLHGAVAAVSGEEGFESTLGPLSCLGMRALALPEDASGGAQEQYVPDFTATALTEKCLMVQVQRARYLQALERSRSGGA